MKYTRLIAGAALIVGALWIIIGEQIAGASADAVVNARVVTVRAPTAGALTVDYRPLGSSIQKGEVVAAVEDPLVDRVRLNDLYMERDFAAAELARAKAETTAVLRHIAQQRDRAEVYRDHRLNELAIRMSDGTDGADAGAGTGGAFDPEKIDPAGLRSGDPEGSQAETIGGPERMQILANARAAVREGVYLGDGYNDAPFAEQWAAQLDWQKSQLDARVALASARLEAINLRIERERVRVSGLVGGDLTSPVDGIVWEILAADGETVQRGDPLIRLVDCGSVMVTLSVSESVYNDLETGTPARIRLSGGRGTVEGTVARLAGTGAETIYRNLAVAPSEKHLQRFDVSLVAPALRGLPGKGCEIGRTARVFFDRRPLDALRRFWF